MKVKTVLILLMCSFCISSALAQGNPPTAQEIANQIEQYWINDNLNDLGTYINGLYQDHPNYIPAILAKAFYHEIFRNHLTDTLTELNRVASAITNNPGLGSKDFREQFEGEKIQLERDIEIYQEEGTTQEQLLAVASPQAVWDEWQTTKNELGYAPIPYLDLIASAPNESI